MKSLSCCCQSLLKHKKELPALRSPNWIEDPRDCSHSSSTGPRGLRGLNTRSFAVLSLSVRLWTLHSQHGHVLVPRSTVDLVPSRPPICLAREAWDEGGNSQVTVFQVLSPVFLSTVRDLTVFASICFFIRLCADDQDTVSSQTDGSD